MRYLLSLTFITLLLIPSLSFGFDQDDLDKLKATNECVGCNLRNAVLIQADLSGANLRKADLSGANLSKANLSKANLGGANLSFAVLTKTNLSGADLSEAKLSNADIWGAKFCKTITPWGIDDTGC